MSLLKDLHSSFWLDEDEFEDDDLLLGDSQQVRKGGISYGDLIKLSGRRRAIANFVSILTGQQIPVEFNSKGHNYTDGKKVVISADANNDTFDSDVGLALHEASHILLSDFKVISRIIGEETAQYAEHRFPILRDDFKSNNKAEEKLQKFLQDLIEIEDIKKHLNESGLIKLQRQMVGYIKDMWNWVEDRRIDNYVFTNAPGYREYYMALYNKYFLTKDVSKALESSEYCDETLASYSMRIINLLNEARDLDALKGLREIVKILDLNNISRIKNSFDALEVAVDIVDVVIKNVDWDSSMNDAKNNKSSNQGDPDVDFQSNDFKDNENSDDDNSESNSSSSDDNDSDGKSSSNMKSGDDAKNKSSNSDSDGDNETSSSSDSDEDKENKNKKELSKSLKKRIENQLQKQKDFLNGNLKKKSASKKDQEAMKAAEQSGSEVVQVGSDYEGYHSNSKVNPIDCIVVKNLTKAVIDAEDFPMKVYQRSNFSSTSVEKGITMGVVLGKKLKIRSEIRELRTMRQRTGRIERRLINELGYGMENVFGHLEISKFKKAMLYISIDASSSMFSGSYTNDNSKWHRTMSASVAMAKAASMIDNLDVRIDFRTTHGNFPYVVIAYDSTKDSFAKIKNLFPMLSPSGYTPEGLCFEALSKSFVPATNERDVYFVNISDGQPYFCVKGVNGFEYAGNPAASHTKRQVDVLRKKGIRVSSYFVEDSSWHRESLARMFKNMYGKDSQFINVDNIHEVAKTMNKKFLDKV